jgi:hypothetical protein
MIRWFRKLREIVRNYDTDRNAIHLKICQTEKRAIEAENVIRSRTDIHADIHYKSDNQIIVVGRYRNRDYVQVFHVAPDDFCAMIEKFRDMERYGYMARVDAPPQMKVVFENELGRRRK